MCTKGSLIAHSPALLKALAAPLPQGLQKPLLDAVESARQSGRGWRAQPAPAPAAFTIQGGEGRAFSTWERKFKLGSSCKHCSEGKSWHFVFGASRYCFSPQKFPCSSCGKTEAMHFGSARTCRGVAQLFAAAQVWTADHLKSGGQKVHPS